MYACGVHFSQYQIVSEVFHCIVVRLSGDEDQHKKQPLQFVAVKCQS